LGVDLWSHPRLRRMFTLPVRYTMPDGTLPRFGDSLTATARGFNVQMATGAHAYGDPVIAAMVSEPTLDSILLGVKATDPAALPRIEGSEVFEGAGHAILRTSGSEGDAGGSLAAVLTFSPFGGFHGHFDKLSFVFFGHGRELGVDPGRAASQAYRLPIHKDWYRATLSHNAVVVDGVSQQPAGGKLKLFVATPSHAAAMASTAEAYPGVEHRRLLLLTPRYLLVLDELRSDRERTFDWWYHHRGESVRCAAATNEGAFDERYIGGKYLNTVREGTNSEEIMVQFASPDVRSFLLMNAQPHTQVRKVRFAAVLEPVAGDKTKQVDSVELHPIDAGTEVLIRCRDGTDRLVLRAPESLAFTRDGKVLLKSPGSP
jgi:oligo-alginate lyase